MRKQEIKENDEELRKKANDCFKYPSGLVEPNASCC